jgi:hypothetical protein
MVGIELWQMLQQLLLQRRHDDYEASAEVHVPILMTVEGDCSLEETYGFAKSTVEIFSSYGAVLCQNY